MYVCKSAGGKVYYPQNCANSKLFVTNWKMSKYNINKYSHLTINGKQTTNLFSAEAPHVPRK